MADRSSIEWTDTTWNPVRGCRPVSPGCKNCYAARQALRHAGPGRPYDGLAKSTRHGPRWTGEVNFVAAKLGEPLRWRDPRRVFVNSMSDLFHGALSFEQIAAVFGVMAAAPQHTFQVLTKRPERAQEFFAWIEKETGGRGVASFCYACACERGRWWGTALDDDRAAAGDPWPLRNVWLGVSVEDQETADRRLAYLVGLPAAVRFVSYEPALGPVDFRRLTIAAPEGLRPGCWLDALTGHYIGPDDVTDDRIHWVIVGGESGPGARPCRVEWLDAAVQQCRAAGVPPFVKQVGASPVGRAGEPWSLVDRKGGDMAEWPPSLRVREFPEVAGG